MQTVTSKDGTTIAFDKIGQGPALILVGGGFTYRSFDQRTAQLASLLGENFTTFNYDRRGRGDSGNTQPYAVEREIEDIDALITEAGGLVFLFGHSSGAVLALDAAQKLTGKIARIALYEPPFIVNDNHPTMPMDYLSHLKDLIAADNRSDAIEYFMTKAVNMPKEVVSGLRQTPMWSGLTVVAPTILYDSLIMSESQTGSVDSLKQWASVAAPTLIVDGGASPEWMHNAAQAIAGVMPHTRCLTLAGQDHGFAPEVLAPVLEEFFKT